MTLNHTISLSLHICLILLFSQCCEKKKTSETLITNSSTPKTEAADSALNQIKTLQSIIVNSEYIWPGSTDQFDILSTRISGDSLLLEVQYGGGCEKHIFAMNTNLIWMKSMPPQLNLWLEHENNNDMCRALITETIAFNLSNCRYPSGKTVTLIINGDREKSIRYNY